MANEVYKICNICQNKYKYCRHCDKKLEPWHVMFDCENCKKIFDILTDYSFENIDKDKAEEALKSCDLSNKDAFREKIRNEIDQIIEPYIPIEESDSAISESVLEPKAPIESTPISKRKSKSKLVIEEISPIEVVE